MDENQRYDVTIVGMGPVGAALAALLAQTGVSVFIADREEAVYPLPRAASFDHETMRIFQQLGIVEDISDSIVTGLSYQFRNVAGDLLLDFDSGRLMPTGWGTYLMHQPAIELALRKAAFQSRSVTAAFPSRFLDFKVEGSEVVSRWNYKQKTLLVRSALLVGCDGASSTIREACKIAQDDLDFDEPWLVLDLKGVDPSTVPAYCLQLCDPERPTTYVVMGANRRRWEFMLKPGESAEYMLKESTIRELLRPWKLNPGFEIERKAVYRFHALVAKQWRQGRVLLAGDAAHQMPPFAGQGMCSGIRDAAALAWRLSFLVKHGVDDRLLDSYQPERESHVRKIIKAAIETGRVVCTLSAEQATARDQQMIAARAAGHEQPDITSPPLELTFGLPQTARAGERFIQPVTSHRGNRIGLDDILGVGFWLLTREAAPYSELAQGLDIRQVCISAPELAPFATELRAWLDDACAEAVLVRADRYVYGSGPPSMLMRSLVEQLGLRDEAPVTQYEKI